MAPLALVTGGNRGIGFALCKKLVLTGSNVLMTARNLPAGKAACSEIEEAVGKCRVCTPVELDQSNPESIDKLVDLVKSEFDQKITALINNAGILLETWDEDSFNSSKKTNFDGPVQLTQKLAPHLAPGCRVVMMSSGYGQLDGLPKGTYADSIASAQDIDTLYGFTYRPNDGSGTYAPTYKITKAMLNRATQLLAVDPLLVSRSITINACCPGWVRTSMGGENAARSPEKGAASALVFLTDSEPVTGTFKRDGLPLQW